MLFCFNFINNIGRRSRGNTRHVAAKGELLLITIRRKTATAQRALVNEMKSQGR